MKKTKKEGGVILWALGSRCNLKCKYCYFGVSKPKQEMPILPDATTESILNFIEKIDSRIERVCLAGGEPLLNKDIYKILEALKKKNISVIISSNGTLITKQCADKLIDCGLDAIFISLDSHSRAYNDGLRGKYNLALRGIKNIIREKERLGSGIKIGIYSVMTKENIKDLPNTMDFIIGLGADYFVFQPIWLPKGHPLHDRLVLTGEQDGQIRNIIDFARSRSSKIIIPCDKYLERLEKDYCQEETGHIRNCFGGRDLFFIDPKGYIHDCPSGFKISDTLSPENIRTSYLPDSNAECSGKCGTYSIDCLPMWELYYSNLLKK